MNKLTSLLSAAALCAAPNCYSQNPMFTAAPAIVGEPGSGEVFLVDINHDGHVDLVTKYIRQQRLDVWSGDGKGQFTLVATKGFDSMPGAVALGDLNNDGTLDLGVASKEGDKESVRIFLGDRKGGFNLVTGPPVSVGVSTPGRDYKPALRFVDLNGDGNLDLVSANGRRNSVEIFLGDGHGKFSAAPIVKLEQSHHPGSSSFGFGDLDGDGHLDLVTAIPGPSDSEPGSVEVRHGNGKGGFADAPSETLSVPPDPAVAAIVDVNGDGHPDIVLNHTTTGILSVLLNNSKGAFTSRQAPIPVGWPAWGVVGADVNRDGKADLVATTVDSKAPFASKVVVLLGDGHGAFTQAPGSPFSVGRGAYGLAVGDVNEDGKPDIATSGFESKTVSLLLGK